MKDKSILVTGATGLVGAHLMRLFHRDGYRHLRATCRSTSRLDLLDDIASTIDFVEGDVRDPGFLMEATEGIDWVIHCAAIVDYDIAGKEAMYAVNTEGTAHAVNAALEHGVEKFLHLSSVACISRTGRIQDLDENDPWEPTKYTTFYGYTKHLAEMEVWRGQAEGLQTAMVNPSLILGSGNWASGSLRIVDRVARGLSFYPVGSNGFVDVRDVARLIVAKLEHDFQPGRMLATGWNNSYRDFLGDMAEALDARKPSIRISPGLAEFAWRALWPLQKLTGRFKTLTKHSVRTTSCRINYDNALSLGVKGFSYTPREKTIRDVAEYYKASHGTDRFVPMEFD